MSTMDHAEAHERIADLALDPSRLAGLEKSPAAADTALREHIAGCSRCQAEVAEWHVFQSTVGNILRATSRESTDAAAPPPDLRRRVLAAANAEPRKNAAAPIDISIARSRVRRSGVALLALAAALAIVAAGLGVWVVTDQARINSAAEDSRALASLAAAISRVSASPDSRVVSLRAADGTVGGSVAWSRHDLVVTASTLSAPVPGQIYRCWLVYEGKQSAIGQMRFAGNTAFWVGWTQDWASVDLQPEAHFVVTLEPDQPTTPVAPAGPVVLEAALGG
jgi:Anti-sigma-K factor rskA